MDAIDGMADYILGREGRVFTDRAADRGGPTHFGITLKTFTAWRMARYGTAPSVADLKKMRESEAREIYAALYISGPGFDRIEDSSLRLNVVDAGVLHGTGWAARRLQEVAGVKADGLVGPVTLKAVNARPENPAICLRFTRRRIYRVGKIVQADTSQIVHLGGWLDRATAFLEMEAAALDGIDFATEEEEDT